MTRKKNRLLAVTGLASACGAMLVLSAPASASPFPSLTITCTPSCTVTQSTDGTGFISALVTGNGWNLNFNNKDGVAGTTKTDSGSASSPNMDLAINGHAAGTLDVAFADDGFTGLGIFETKLTQANDSTVTSSLITSWFQTTPPGTTLSDISQTSASITDFASANITGSYGLQMFAEVKGSGLVSIDDKLETVPEPGTLALFGAGLLGIALFFGRRRSPNV